MSIDDPILRLLLSLEPLPDDGTADVGFEDLLPAVKSGEPAAKKALVKQYLRVVVWFVRESGPVTSMDHYLDLIHAGNLGVLSAAQQFEPSIGMEFPAYVRLRISNSIKVFRQKESIGSLSSPD